MTKIKNNQEDNSSAVFQRLFNLKRYPPKRLLRWLVFTAFIFISWGWWKTPFFVIWWLPVLVISIVVLYGDWADWRRSIRLKQLESLKIESQIWRHFERLYPHVKIQQRRLIEQGFKDYLALHILRKQAYAMPSHAVDALWHILLEYPDTYRQLCQRSLGRVLQHQPYDTNTSSEVQQQQLYAAWQYSCRLHQLNPRHAHHLPRLFAIDQLLQWQGGQSFDRVHLQNGYAAYLNSQSSSSSSCGSSCGSCGGD